MKPLPRAISLLLTSGVTACLATHAFAADDDAKKAEAKPTKDNQMEAVVITGSRVPTVPGAVAAKVVTIDADAIAQAGVESNVMEVLRKSLPSFQGRSNAGTSNANNTNQNTAGGSQIQLRNLDTLILINGRRAAISGIAGIGGKAFVDINQIPASAVDHIEVLSDGASAIYGSDAVGGVVNIILKSNYNGAEIGGRYGSASGNYSEHSAYFTFGKSFGGLNITVSGSDTHTDPLYQRDRSFSSPLLFNPGRVSVAPGSIGGATPAILAPGLNAPGGALGPAATAANLAALIANGTYVASTTAGIAATFDVTQFQTLLLKQDAQAISVSVNDELMGKKLVAFGDVQVAKNKSFTQFLPITNTFTVPAGSPFNPIAGNVSGVNFAYFPRPKQFFNDTDSVRIALGLRGDLGDNWNWEAAYVHSKNELQQRQANVLYRPNLTLAIAGGFDASGNAIAGGAFSKVNGNFATGNTLVLQPALNAFARAGGVNPASLENLYGTEVIDTSSSLDSFDVTLTGTISELPAGKPGFAIGLSTRRDKLSASTDPNGNNTGPTAQRWLGGTNADAYAASRKVDAAFFELRVPITSKKWNFTGANSLDVIVAGREERYSDAGNSFVPKYGIRWQPIDDNLTIRGSYGKAFTAPTLYALSGPTATRIAGSGIITGAFGLPNPGLQALDGNNPNLKPSTSNTHSFSLTLTPAAVPGLKLSAEYSVVNQSGYPGGIGFNNILLSVNNLGSASPFSANLARGNFPGLPGAVPFTTPGELRTYLAADPNNSLNTYAIDRFTNLGGIRVRAYGLSGQYDIPTDKAGTFSLATTGTVFKSFQFQALSSQKFYEFAGTSTNGGGAQGSLPKYRFYTSLGWDFDYLNINLGNTYASATEDQFAGGLGFETASATGAQKSTPVERYMAWDLRFAVKGDSVPGGYGKGWTVAVGVNNISNKAPPLSPFAFQDNNADAASYSPIGRFTYITASLKF